MIVMYDRSSNYTFINRDPKTNSTEFEFKPLFEITKFEKKKFDFQQALSSKGVNFASYSEKTVHTGGLPTPGGKIYITTRKALIVYEEGKTGFSIMVDSDITSNDDVLSEILPCENESCDISRVSHVRPTSYVSFGKYTFFNFPDVIRYGEIDAVYTAFKGSSLVAAFDIKAMNAYSVFLPLNSGMKMEAIGSYFRKGNPGLISVPESSGIFINKNCDFEVKKVIGQMRSLAPLNYDTNLIKAFTKPLFPSNDGNIASLTALLDFTAFSHKVYGRGFDILEESAKNIKVSNLVVDLSCMTDFLNSVDSLIDKVTFNESKDPNGFLAFARVIEKMPVKRSVYAVVTGPGTFAQLLDALVIKYQELLSSQLLNNYNSIYEAMKVIENAVDTYVNNAYKTSIVDTLSSVPTMKTAAVLKAMASFSVKAFTMPPKCVDSVDITTFKNVIANYTQDYDVSQFVNFNQSSFSNADEFAVQLTNGLTRWKSLLSTFKTAGVWETACRTNVNTAASAIATTLSSFIAAARTGWGSYSELASKTNTVKCSAVYGYLKLADKEFQRYKFSGETKPTFYRSEMQLVGNTVKIVLFGYTHLIEKAHQATTVDKLLTNLTSFLGGKFNTAFNLTIRGFDGSLGDDGASTGRMVASVFGVTGPGCETYYTVPPLKFSISCSIDLPTISVAPAPNNVSAANATKIYEALSWLAAWNAYKFYESEFNSLKESLANYDPFTRMCGTLTTCSDAGMLGNLDPQLTNVVINVVRNLETVNPAVYKELDGFLQKLLVLVSPDFMSKRVYWLKQADLSLATSEADLTVLPIYLYKTEVEL